MHNELLFLFIIVFDLAVMMIAWRLGKLWLYVWIIMNAVFSYIFGLKFINIFGFDASGVTITYAAIFIGTDILTEHYGKRAGYKMVWLTFSCVVLFVIFQQLFLLFEATQESQKVAEAMRTLFSQMPRLAFAGLLAFVIAQRFDIWFYHFLHEKTKGRMLWLRNNLSTMTSQLLDTAIFFTIGFYGTVPGNVLLQLMATAYTAKILVAVLDTPLIYLSYWVKGKPLNRANIVPADNLDPDANRLG